MKKCKACGELTINADKFCDACGASGFSEVPSAICPVCNLDNPLSAKNCMHCGSALIVPVPERSDAEQRHSVVETRQSVRVNANVLKDYKDNLFCPHCNEKLSLNMVFCSSCGMDVSRTEQAKTVKRVVCPTCAHVNAVGTRYCSYCFTALKEVEVGEYLLGYQVADTEEAVVIKQVVVSDGVSSFKECTSCGTLIDPSLHYCFKCGTPTRINIKRKYCLDCGYSNPIDAKHCINCNALFGRKDSDIWLCKCDSLNNKDSAYCTNCGKSRPVNKEDKYAK